MKDKSKKNIGIIIVVVVILILIITVFCFNFFFKKGGSQLYEVGKDIEAGEYVLVGNGVYEILDSEPNYGYYAICTNKNCDNNLSSIVANDNVFGKAYVLLENGQFLKTKYMDLIKLEDYNSQLDTNITINNPLKFNDYYKVGKDISAGTYELVGNNFTYEICTKPRCKISLNQNENEVITNEYSNDNGAVKTITLENGQYFVIASSGTLKVSKIGG